MTRDELPECPLAAVAELTKRLREATDEIQRLLDAAMATRQAGAELYATVLAEIEAGRETLTTQEVVMVLDYSPGASSDNLRARGLTPVGETLVGPVRMFTWDTAQVVKLATKMGRRPGWGRKRRERPEVGDDGWMSTRDVSMYLVERFGLSPAHSIAYTWLRRRGVKPALTAGGKSLYRREDVIAAADARPSRPWKSPAAR